METITPNTPSYAAIVRQLNAAAEHAELDDAAELTAKQLNAYGEHRGWGAATLANAYRVGHAHQLVNIPAVLSVPTAPIDLARRITPLTSLPADPLPVHMRGAAWAAIAWQWPAALTTLLELNWGDLADLDPRPSMPLGTIPVVAGWQKFLRHEYPDRNPAFIPVLCRMDRAQKLSLSGANRAWAAHVRRSDLDTFTYDSLRRHAISAGAAPVDRFNRTQRSTVLAA